MTGLFSALPKEVSVYEVSPRDGLQNESVTVSTEGKVELVNALVDAGLQRIEVASFVSPKWVPQLADGEQLLHLLPRKAGVVFSALCPNMQGLERAKSARIEEIGVFLSASETHNKRNINKTIAETLALFRELVPAALANNIRVRGYVSTVWGCPYEGDVDPRRAIDVAAELFKFGCYEVSLGDTIGAGTPLQTRSILMLFKDAFGSFDRLAMHMHDTRGTALANCLVGLDLGVRTFDAAVGGMGGCPYAPGAAGNLATEDLIYMLDKMGVSTGIDLDKLWKAGKVASSVVGRALPGKVHQAGPGFVRKG
ncbi:MAG: hydroxymethylglutaryl-CoA lyase [Sandaracinaceae bacterium]|nr:hydroxymethylglutaryl-CoA lyase [Sandaracinaceae bacterium]